MDHYRDLVKNIQQLFADWLASRQEIEKVRREIWKLLQDESKNLRVDQTNLVIILPNSQPFIHINQTYDQHPPVNLNITLTPSPSGHLPILLVHPQVVAFDSQELLPDKTKNQQLLASWRQAGLNNSVVTVYRGSLPTETCQLQHHRLDWSSRCHQTLRVHPGDHLIFQNNLLEDQTVTSCNQWYEILLQPDYDLTVPIDGQVEIILVDSGDYYFTSRLYQSDFQLHVHVRRCQYH